LGARKVGFAKPALVSALVSDEALGAWMSQMEFELKVALFCSGVKTPEALRKGKLWQKT
jgi:isopentenyl-diphosphate delta-isomerase